MVLLFLVVSLVAEFLLVSDVPDRWLASIVFCSSVGSAVLNSFVVRTVINREAA